MLKKGPHTVYISLIFLQYCTFVTPLFIGQSYLNSFNIYSIHGCCQYVKKSHFFTSKSFLYFKFVINLPDGLFDRL
jgi:hypothetical protein